MKVWGQNILNLPADQAGDICQINSRERSLQLPPPFIALHLFPFVPHFGLRCSVACKWVTTCWQGPGPAHTNLSPSLWTWWTSSSRVLKARPKSMTLKTPSWLDQRMLPGFRSPCTMFPLWREKRETRISWANLRLAHGDSPRLSFL